MVWEMVTVMVPEETGASLAEGSSFDSWASSWCSTEEEVDFTLEDSGADEASVGAKVRTVDEDETRETLEEAAAEEELEVVVDEVSLVGELVDDELEADDELEVAVVVVDVLEVLELEVLVLVEVLEVVVEVDVFEVVTTFSPVPRYPLSWSMKETPSELVLLTPEEASHNMKPPKLLSLTMESETYFLTVVKSAYPLPAELVAPGKPTYNLISLFGEEFSAKSFQVSQLKLAPRLQ